MSGTHILLASPYHGPLDAAEWATGRPYPPLGTMVSAAALRERGLDVALYDPGAQGDVEAFGAALDGHRPRQVAIVADPHSVPVKMCTRAQRSAALRMVALAKARGAEVLVAGPDPTDHPGPFLDAGADVAVVGEHDEALREFAEGGAGRGVIPRRAPMADLDPLPDPAWELVDLPAYARRWRSAHGAWEMNVSTARGCPYRCNWCAKPTWGRAYHARSPGRVVREIDALRDRHRPDRLWFTDDIFAIRPAWLAEYRSLVGPRPLPYRCLTRADLVRDDRYVEDLARSGCVETWMGAESGSDAVLAAMDKGATVEDVRRAAERLRAHGIRRGLFLQLGYPGETAADIDRTRAMVRELRPEAIGISVSYPLPGTEFYERVRAEMPAEAWEVAMENRVLHRAPFPQAFYDAAREVLRAEHAVLQFHPSAGRAGLRRAAGVAYHAARWPWHRARMRWHAAIP